jgi:hypothetical protein
VAREACLRLRRWYEFIAARPPGSPDLNVSHLRTAWRADASVAAGGVVVADVFLAFHPCPRGYTPAFASGPFDALDASQPSRLRDAYELSLVLRTEPDASLPAAADPWSGIAGATVAERLESAERLSLTLWRRVSEPAPENPPGVEPTAVLLARLRLPAQPATDVQRAPIADWAAGTWSAEETNVNNRVRHILLPPRAVRRVLAG